MDNLSKKDRSKCMSRICSKNTSIEKTIFALLDQSKISYEKHFKIIGKPDIAFPRLRIAIFLDSDFWHGWNFPRWKNNLPKTYWRDKIENNRKRDRSNFQKLRNRGWKVIRIWSHEIEQNSKKSLKRILGLIKNGLK